VVAKLGIRSLNGLRTLEGLCGWGDARIDDQEEERAMRKGRGDEHMRLAGTV
jgi:hypothetical protein